MQVTVDALDDVDDVAGRQQRAAGRARRCRRTRARSGAAVPGTPAIARVAVVDGTPSRDRERGGGHAAGVEHADPHRAAPVGRAGRPGRARPRTGRRRRGGCRSSAGRRRSPGRRRPAGRDSRRRPRRRATDPTIADLRRQRVGTADPVDLAGVGRAHDPQQQVVALGRIGRQVGGEEVRPLRRSAPHHHAAHAGGRGAHTVRSQLWFSSISSPLWVFDVGTCVAR